MAISTALVANIPNINTLPALTVDTILAGPIDSVEPPTGDDIVDSDTPTVSLI